MTTKPELGTKRSCRKCSAPFYDLNKDPMTCPKCGKTFQAEEFTSKYVAKGRSQKPEVTVDEVFELEMEEDDEVLDADEEELIETETREDE
jgi:uncharacterized protein (TIGR02300 family)